MHCAALTATLALTGLVTVSPTDGSHISREPTSIPLSIPPTAAGQPTSAPTTAAPTGANTVQLPSGGNHRWFCGGSEGRTFDTSIPRNAMNLIEPEADVPEVWVRYDAEIGGRHTFSTCSEPQTGLAYSSPYTMFDTRVTIFARNGNSYGEEIASCDDCGPCGAHASLTVDLPVGQYWIVVDARPDAVTDRGQFSLQILCPTPTQGELPCDTSVFGSVVDAANTYGWGRGDHFYNFVAPHDGEYIFDTCGSEVGFWSIVSVFRQADNLTIIDRSRVEFSTRGIDWLLQQEQDVGGTWRCGRGAADRYHASLKIFLSAGTYGIGVDGYDDSVGIYKLTATCPTPEAQSAPPPTDGIVTCGATITGTTVGGVSLVDADTVFTRYRDSPDVSCCGVQQPRISNSSAPERWYEFTAPTTGHYTFDTCGSEANTYLHVFVRDPITNHYGDQLAQRDSNDGCRSNNSNAIVRSAFLVGGGAYWIVVDGPGQGWEGSFRLDATCPSLGCGAPPVRASTFRARNLLTADPSPERYHSFTAPVTGQYTINSCSAAAGLGSPITNPTVYVINRDTDDVALDLANGASMQSCSGDSCNTCPDADDRAILSATLIGGTTYWVAVEGNGTVTLPPGDFGDYELSVACPPAVQPTAAPTSTPTTTPTTTPTMTPTTRSPTTRSPTTRSPTTPSPTTEPPTSCLAGNAIMEQFHPADGTTSAVRVRDIARGDVIRGAAGDDLRPTYCTVEAIGGFGYGAVYGDYTDHHYLLDNSTRSIVAAGSRGLPAVDDDKYVVLLGTAADEPTQECMAGIDSNSMLYTPLDTDFCGVDVTLSFDQYKMLYKFILRTVRASGAFWLRQSSYTARIVTNADGSAQVLQWNDGTPRLCAAMIACASSNDASSSECAHYEQVGAQFVDGFMTPAAQQATHQAFPHLGDAGQPGSASYAAMNNSTDDNTPWHIAVGVLAAFLLMGLILVVVGALWYNRHRDRATTTTSPIASNMSYHNSRDPAVAVSTTEIGRAHV